MAISVVGPPIVPIDQAIAANLAGFDPGNIISDAVFFDAHSMSLADLQAFLAAKGAACSPASDGTACLKDYRQTTYDRAPDSYCPGGYVGAANEPASTIIYKVAQACGINPRVIVVTLQKEQGLVTRSVAGTASVYGNAMGYGCPDTSTCNPAYAGFFNQVYSAALGFKYYTAHPTWFNHVPGRINNILYNPNSACGSSPVFIQNQATANLYNYTPYQPNAAALAAGYGTGDSCSAYGNRNFWNYFTDWFGSTQSSAPRGFLDSVTATAFTITASGWALDPDTTGPVTVHIYLDNNPIEAVTANTSRPDIGAAYPNYGDAHGFTATIAASPGVHTLCVYAINTPAGANPSIGCRTITVVNNTPRGFVDSVSSTATSITASGWALDPDTADPVTVQLYVDNNPIEAVTANGSRTDIGAAFPGYGDAHGFTATIAASPGPHTLCVYAINTPAGVNPSIGCRTVTVVNNTPVGFVDSVSTAAGSITASGWALDPDTHDPLTVQLFVDNTLVQGVTANGSRTDIGAAFPGYGDAHGFTATIAASPGPHTLCVYAINTPAGANPSIGCRTVRVPGNATPVGFVDGVSSTATSITASGWALDPDTADPLTVHVYLDNNPIEAVTANGSRTDIGAAFPGYGDAHGFTATIAASPGPHTLCVYAINTPAGVNPSIGCRTVTVVNNTPVGFVDSVSTAAGSITASGWALDPDTHDPLTVQLFVDNTLVQGVTANGSRTDIGAAFPGYGDAHGFTATIAASPGPHTLCVYAINTPAGVNPSLGCRALTVAQP